jgi:uncharacterized protein (TIGR03790 family)
MRRTLSFILLTLLWVWGGAQGAMSLPRPGLRPADVALVINTRDDYSVRIGEYYQRRRGIPRTQVIELAFKPGKAKLEGRDLKRVLAEVRARTPAHVQAYALAWTLPYSADCMSITTAFATGNDPRYCAKKTCTPTQSSPYFNSNTTRPWNDLKLRPAMLLAARNEAEGRALIERGIAADGSHPQGSAYLVSTSDEKRNVRARGFARARELLGSYLPVQIIVANEIGAAQDVLFYFTGLRKVAGLERLRFLPGALADHLTSYGGKLDSHKQMPAIEWLGAGATGSYGTVKEPCNYPQKFPLPGLAMARYLSGETLIESYWKSVAWPAEGVFIGEPLARPFGYAAKARTQFRIRGEP